MLNTEAILKLMPYMTPFLFVEELVQVTEEGAEGTFTFHKSADYYKGHFKNNPITPGVLLTECCAQIGVVSLGIFLLGSEDNDKAFQIGMSSTQMEFYKPVHPDTKVRVCSKKQYFRFNKLKCDVQMFTMQGDLICKGVIAGMLKRGVHE